VEEWFFQKTTEGVWRNGFSKKRRKECGGMVFPKNDGRSVEEWFFQKTTEGVWRGKGHYEQEKENMEERGKFIEKREVLWRKKGDLLKVEGL
jgi:hypothetical protein